MLHLAQVQSQFSDHLVKSPLYPQYIPLDSSDFSLAFWDKIKQYISLEWRKRAGSFSRRPRGVVDPLATTRALTKSQGLVSRSRQIKISVLNLRDLGLSGSSRVHSQHVEQQYIQDVSMERHDRTASAAPKSSHRHTKPHARRGQTPEQYIADKRQEAIETVMAVFNKWLNTRLAVISHVYESSSGSSGSSDSPGAGANPGAGNDKAGRASRRAKRQFNGDGGHEDDSAAGGGGDGDGQDRGGNDKKRARTATEELRFACPFFQHDPNKHCTHRSCIGPGWTSIHRLKEHLTRIHRLPKHTCPRCQEPMSDGSDLEAHLRADISCTKRDKIPLQGINDAQEKKIKERKKTSAILTEEQKWKDIYMILFPDANKNALPSPYYNTQDPAAFAKTAAQWKRLRTHIEKELPGAVRQKVEHRFENVQEELLNGLGDIVRTEVFHLFRGFTGKSPSASPSPGPASRAATPKASPRAPELDDAKNLNLDYFINDPNAPFSLLGGFDFDQQLELTFDCQQSDSGYASNATVSASRDFVDWS